MVELLDNNVGVRGATALGNALAMGQARRLLLSSQALSRVPRCPSPLHSIPFRIGHLF